MKGVWAWLSGEPWRPLWLFVAPAPLALVSVPASAVAWLVLPPLAAAVIAPGAASLPPRLAGLLVLGSVPAVLAISVAVEALIPSRWTAWGALAAIGLYSSFLILVVAGTLAWRRPGG